MTHSKARMKGATMGVIYIVLPLSHEEDEIISWLHSLRLTCPPDEGRYPTIEELRFVLDHLDGYSIHYSTGAGHWYADVSPTDQVTSDWACIVVDNYHDNDTDSHDFYFERGSPRVMLLILQRLTRMCGPLILLADTGDLPMVVTADLDLDQALHAWDI